MPGCAKNAISLSIFAFSAATTKRSCKLPHRPVSHKRLHLETSRCNEFTMCKPSRPQRVACNQRHHEWFWMASERDDWDLLGLEAIVPSSLFLKRPQTTLRFSAAKHAVCHLCSLFLFQFRFHASHTIHLSEAITLHSS